MQFLKNIFLTVVTVLLLIGLYINFATNLYVRIQAISICRWINTGKGDQPAVGPQALQHLTWLKNAPTGDYRYMITKPNIEFDNPYVCTILISENGEEKIRLNYKLRYKPVYFHHQTNFEHNHK